MTFTCNYCNRKFPFVSGYNVHLKSHRYCKNVKYMCVLTTCKRIYETYESFRSHNFRLHTSESFKHKVTENIYNNCHTSFVQCEKCNKRIRSRNLKYHIALHDIDSGKSVSCPQSVECLKTFNSAPSLKTHVYRYHFPRIDTSIENIQNNLDFMPHRPNSDFDTPNPNEIVCIDIDTNQFESASQITNSNDTYEESQLKSELFHMKDMLLVLVKLESKNLLSQDAIFSIVESFADIHENALQSIKDKCLSDLKDFPDCLNILERNVFNMRYTESMKCTWRKALKSRYSRFSLYREYFSVVLPVTIKLGRDNFHKVCHFHYVPILETIQSMFQDKSFVEQFNTPYDKVNGLLRDISCGSRCSQDVFFNNSNNLKIILFQDAFEICNPLGSSKTKHKMLGVYMTFANLLPYNRSKVDSIKLVLLCKEKYLKEFDQVKIFKTLIDDIKILENTGVYIENLDKVLHGSLLTLIGDNLGSHTVGGFVENFNATHFCRFCLIEKVNFEKDPTLVGKIRNHQEYCKDVDMAKALNSTDGTTEQLRHSRGVKRDSVFNSLEHYHVVNGLPPCIGHDLFEGVVQYDLPLIINSFIKSNLFSEDVLNMKIEKIINEDKIGIPRYSKRCKKLGGQALENWYFLKYIPFLLLEYIDEENPLWKMIITLREIAMLVCAYEISIGQTAVITSLSKEYLTLRKDYFPGVPLRPKHHFMLHYGHLTRVHGPLIYTWTLRFESKHRFFKNIVRHLPNFINISKSLSYRHQLYQGYLGQGTQYTSTIVAHNALKLTEANISPEIMAVFYENELDIGNTLTSNIIHYKGLKYAVGDYILHKRGEGLRLYFIKIRRIFFEDYENPIFIGTCEPFEYNLQLGLCQSCTEHSHTELLLCKYKDLLQFHAYKPHTIGITMYIVLHHSYVDFYND